MTISFPEAQRPMFEYAVGITVEIEREAGLDRGAGIIFSTQGHILTAMHVIEGRTEWSIRRFRLSKNGWRTIAVGAPILADVVLADREADLAILKMRRVPKNLVVAAFGDSKYLEKGDPIFHVGRPLVPQKLFNGHIIRFDTKHADRNREMRISLGGLSGSSGGPILDQDRNVVGIFLRTADETHLPTIVYAIDSDSAKAGILWRWAADELKTILSPFPEMTTQRNP